MQNDALYLRSGDGLNLQCVVQERRAREVLLDVGFQDLNTHVWVVDLRKRIMNSKMQNLRRYFN